MADVSTGECPTIAAAANRSPKSWLHLAVGQRTAANSITHVCKWGCKFTGVSFDEVVWHEATCKLKFTNASGQELSEGDLYMHYFQGKSREDIPRVAAREVWGEESHEREDFSLRDSLSPSQAKNVVSLEEEEQEDQEESAGRSSSRLLQHAGGSVNWLHDTHSVVLYSSHAFFLAFFLS
jgi:hypothetical protein